MSSQESAQKPPRQLLEPIVTRLFGFLEHHLDMRTQRGLAPVVPGGALGQLRFAHARRFEQCTRGFPVVVRVIAWWETIVATRHLAFGVVAKKGSRHDGWWSEGI